MTVGVPWHVALCQVVRKKSRPPLLSSSSSPLFLLPLFVLFQSCLLGFEFRECIQRDSGTHILRSVLIPIAYGTEPLYYSSVLSDL